MHYRTRTYIAGEWDGDSDAIEQLHKWNEGNKWSLHFVDAHSFKTCYDSSMPCTIKADLAERMGRSKTFVLVVGENTATARKGSCAYMDCGRRKYSFTYGTYFCTVPGKTYSSESFINFECRLAYEAYLEGDMKIVVLYNNTVVHKSKCPEVLRKVGTHIAMKYYNSYWGKDMFDYSKVKNAIEN